MEIPQSIKEELSDLEDWLQKTADSIKEGINDRSLSLSYLGEKISKYKSSLIFPISPELGIWLVNLYNERTKEVQP